ncbi:hypothetical protein [Cryobacterium sp. Y29]|uniref:hypothetical protein n=1 Tax=Cryobacterium sp. Y29 TaxID=2048285 RepID=UPI000CE44C0B|nr:hypothetical protein [Cryobacterium sp. Y29]
MHPWVYYLLVSLAVSLLVVNRGFKYLKDHPRHIGTPLGPVGLAFCAAGVLMIANFIFTLFLIFTTL